MPHKGHLHWSQTNRRIDVDVRLSRRNLRVLLPKLADPDSKATIAREVTPGLLLVVCAEHDDEHYRARNPGPVPP